jgi:hypothetical protein
MINSIAIACVIVGTAFTGFMIGFNVGRMLENRKETGRADAWKRVAVSAEEAMETWKGSSEKWRAAYEEAKRQLDQERLRRPQ